MFMLQGMQVVLRPWVIALAAWGGMLLPSLSAQAQDIVIGQIGPFTGLPVPDAPQVNQGIRAYLAQVNKAGGVQGRKISLFELDDGYSADGFVSRMEEAMQRKPVALISPVGSAAIKRMLDDKLLDKHDVVVMNAVPGAEALRNPGHPRLFHVRAGDKQQLEKIVNHARTLSILKLGVLYQNIPMGASGMKVVQDEAARLTGMDVKGLQASTNPEELAKAAQEVAKLNAQGVLVIGAPPFASAGVAQLRKVGVTQSIFILSDTAPGLLVKVAGDSARGVGIAQVYPNPNGRTSGLMREFQAAMKAAYPDMSSYATFQLEGYLSARVLVEGLRRSKDVTKPEALAKALRGMGELDMDGYRIDFSKGNAGSRFVDIAVVGADGRLLY
jgi:ABC-type branched-subunit amino acid transport system substrate-binding protein